MSTDDSGRKDTSKKSASRARKSADSGTAGKKTAARGKAAAGTGKAAAGKQTAAAKKAGAGSGRHAAGTEDTKSATTASGSKKGARSTAAKPSRNAAKSAARGTDTAIRKLPDNIVQFPGAAAKSKGKAMMQHHDLPSGQSGFADSVISDTLEFASVTAFETADLLGQVAGSALSHELTGPYLADKDPDNSTDLLLQLLNIVLVKLRGLATIVPAGGLLSASIPNVEQVAGYDEVQSECQSNADVVQGLLYDIFEQIYDPEKKLGEFEVFEDPDVIEVLDEVCTSVQDIAMLLDEIVTVWYDEFDKE